MTISADNFANLMGVSKATLQAWETNHVYEPQISPDGTKYFELEDLAHIPEIKAMLESRWDEEMQIIPNRNYFSIELFAGGGGLALGMSLAGFKHVLLNEFDHWLAFLVALSSLIVAVSTWISQNKTERNTKQVDDPVHPDGRPHYLRLRGSRIPRRMPRAER